MKFGKWTKLGIVCLACLSLAWLLAVIIERFN
jgi:hypothetical protein